MNKTGSSEWGRRKSLLGTHHSNHCCKQDPPTDGTISVQNFEETQDINIVSKYYSQSIY